MQLNISDDNLRQLVREAIFAGIPQDKRDALVSDAIKNLLDADPRSYGDKSQLQRAFENAINSLVFEVVRERVKEDQALRAKVSGQIEAALTAFAENESLASLIAEGMSHALKSRYR